MTNVIKATDVCHSSKEACCLILNKEIGDRKKKILNIESPILNNDFDEKSRIRGEVLVRQ